MRDAERVARVAAALREAGLDAVVCALPVNVLLLSGYWPVIGSAVALADREGVVRLAAPADERDLVGRGWADQVCWFEPGSLEDLRTAADALRAPLAELARRLPAGTGRVGYEAGPSFEPASYAAMRLAGASFPGLLAATIPDHVLVPADELLAKLRAVPTPRELGHIRVAAGIAARAYEAGAAALAPGLRETEVAVRFQAPLETLGVDEEGGVARAGGAVSCMAGPDSELAYGSYARSRARRIEVGELLLVHCNSFADGYWTDITRTYCLGDPGPRRRAMYDAVLAARAAALAAIRPGLPAAEVDHAARHELQRRGFGAAFKHPTGHGVGFAAIDHDARPRLHPHSPDRLERGMVFNVEPALYVEGAGGIRHCDMVAVTEQGAELLTPFHATVAELVRGDGGG